MRSYFCAGPYLESTQRLRCDTPFRLRPFHVKAKSQELPLPWAGHCALCLIDRKLETPTEAFLEIRQKTSTRPFAAYINVAVIGISGETVTSLFKLFVEFIEH